MVWKLLQLGVVALWTYLLIEGPVTSTGQLPPLEMILVGGIGLGDGMAALVTGIVYWTMKGGRVLWQRVRLGQRRRVVDVAGPSTRSTLSIRAH
jgi:hypothetical protein